MPIAYKFLKREFSCVNLSYRGKKSYNLLSNFFNGIGLSGWCKADWQSILFQIHVLYSKQSCLFPCHSAEWQGQWRHCVPSICHQKIYAMNRNFFSKTHFVIFRGNTTGGVYCDQHLKLTYIPYTSISKATSCTVKIKCITPVWFFRSTTDVYISRFW